MKQKRKHPPAPASPPPTKTLEKEIAPAPRLSGGEAAVPAANDTPLLPLPIATTPAHTEARRAFIINVVYYAVIAALVFLVFKYVLSWVAPFLFGLIIALVLNRPVNFFAKKLHINRRVVGVFSVGLFYLFIVVTLWIIGTNLVSKLTPIFSSLPGLFTNTVIPFFTNLIENANHLTQDVSPELTGAVENLTTEFTAWISRLISQLSTGAVDFLTGWGANLPSIFTALVFSILSSVFISMDFPAIKGFLVRQIPDKTLPYLQDLQYYAAHHLLSYFRAWLILMTITFAELALGFGIVNYFISPLPGFLALAGLVALLDALPLLGTGGVLAPWATIELIRGNAPLAVAILVIYAVVWVVRSTIEPRVVGGQLGLHPIVSVTAMYFGFKTMGFLGMIAMPIAVIILISFHRSGKLHLWKT